MHARTTTIEATSRETAPDRSAFLQAVLDGLAGPRKSVPSKFLYDATGSRLFDEITTLDEYYPTRTELSILDANADEIAELAGSNVTLVEFGSGSGHKVRLLLNALDQPRAYVPVEIAREHLMASAASLARDYPELRIEPIHADFTRPVTLPDLGPGRRVGFFPGSTIGNFTPDEAAEFLGHAATSLGRDAAMVIGVDLKKDTATLHAAYNDRAGITAAFNLNLLTRINRELGGNFDLRRFRHHAPYEVEKGRVEMHLVSLCEQTVTVAGRRFHFAAGESIHTENSYKYTIEEFASLAGRGSWEPQACWTDPGHRFSVHFLRRS